MPWRWTPQVKLKCTYNYSINSLFWIRSLNETEILKLLFPECFQMCLASIGSVYMSQSAHREAGEPAVADLTHLWHHDKHLKMVIGSYWVNLIKQTRNRAYMPKSSERCRRTVTIDPVRETAKWDSGNHSLIVKPEILCLEIILNLLEAKN